jgi:tight adherence protein C
MLTYFILIFASVVVLIWMFVSIMSGHRYEELIDSVDSKIFPLKDLFGIGFWVLDKVHFSTKTARAIRRTDDIAEITGKKYAEYYYYVSKTAEVTYGLLMLTVFSVLAALVNSIVFFGIGLLLAVLAVYYVEEQINNKLSDRKEELLSDFPQVLSKLTLLINSGMVVREAWNLVAKSGSSAIYREMQETTIEFQNGVTEIEAYSNFAARCGIKEIRKFASTMVQNLQKGNSELVFFLKDMTDEMWEEKKNLCKRKGEAANSKLLIPSGLIFLGILVLIMVPMIQEF